MPTVIETTVTGYACCPDGLCPGYEQVEVPVVRREQQFSFVELGGDLPGIERSTIDAAGFADASDIPCPYCAKDRFVALDVRPEYPKSSGQDPLRLLNLTHDKQVRDMQISGLERDKEMAEMKALLQEQRAMIAELSSERQNAGGTPSAPRRQPPKGSGG